MVVLGKDVGDGRNIWACDGGEPCEATDEFLESFVEFVSLSVIDMSLCGMASTGYPLRYGVLAVRESVLSRPAFFTRLLTSACCVM